VLQYNTNIFVLRAYGATAGTGQMAFQVGGGGGGADFEAMRIDSSGNLLVGTTDTTAFDGTSGINIGGDRNAIAFSSTGTNQRLIYSKSTGLQFYNATTNLDQMLLTDAGDLLVGTTSASGTGGSGIKLTNPTSPADDGKLMIVGASSTIAQDGIQMYSTGASAYRFFVQYSGQVNATSTSINAISDISLKENIRDLDKGLETVLALQPRRFDWINGDGNDIMGFVAQEVETVLPELVHDYKYNDEETKLGLKMGDMIPSMVKAIQEQQALIESLTARITQLENN
tara:strand:- start:139 stop:993 length:855 start_codon:yes stop_codon:yes gene_type:complete